MKQCPAVNPCPPRLLTSVRGRAARPAGDNSPQDFDVFVTAYLNSILRSRALVTLANLSARKDAKPELIKKLLDYVDQSLAAAQTAVEAAGAGGDKKASPSYADMPWKSFKYQLLVALDRPKDLETALRACTRGDDPLSYWQIALAYLLAEQGKLSLEDDLTKFLPDYPTNGTKITIEHLLTHTSGIKSYTSIPE